MTGDTETSILLRLAAPELDDLSDESAEALLRLHFDIDDLERVTELMGLSSEGRLSDEQRAELDCYLRVGHFLSMVQSKARVCLKQGESGARERQAESTTGQEDWFFNTNETWAEGAYRQMLAKSVIALYGYPEGVGEAKLQRPAVGDRVFAFVNKIGCCCRRHVSGS